VNLVRRYLSDILYYARRIERIKQRGHEAFYADDILQDAVIRQYEVIGEIVKRLPDDVLEKQPHINWRALKGFRDFWAHNYDRIDLDVMWDIMEQLPELKDAVQALLDSLPADEEDTP